MVDIRQYSNRLTEKELGIWVSDSFTPISYPDEGNDWCLSLEENSFWFQHRNTCIVESLNQFPPGGPVFAVGGGNGFVSLALVREGMESVLVEPGESGINNAKKRGLKPVIRATIQDASFHGNSLPAIGLFDVVEHIEKDLEFFASIRNYLKPSGRVYVTVPAFQSLWSYEDTHAGHFRRYRLKEIEKLLSKSGFEIEYATYFFSILPIPIFAFRTIPTLLGIRKSPTLQLESKEHHQRQGLSKTLLDRVMSWEVGLIRRKKKIPFGSSILLVAKGK